MMANLKDCCTLSFFKGAALKDADGALERPGPNSHYPRYLKFRSVDEVHERRAQTVQLVQQAIEAEWAGVEITPPENAEPIPAELEERLAQDPALRQAFDKLIPGRQRSYILHVGSRSASRRSSQAKATTSDE